MALSIVSNDVAAALREVACTGGQLGVDGGVGIDPVGERVLAILDDGLAGFVAVICGTGLAWGDWGVINQLEKVVSVTGDNRHLLAVLAKSIELVSESSLELLTGDVGQLGLCDEGLGLSTDELLLENDDSWGVWLLVLELGNLVGDLLLA